MLPAFEFGFFSGTQLLQPLVVIEADIAGGQEFVMAHDGAAVSAGGAVGMFDGDEHELSFARSNVEDGSGIATAKWICCIGVDIGHDGIPEGGGMIFRGGEDRHEIEIWEPAGVGSFAVAAEDAVVLHGVFDKPLHCGSVLQSGELLLRNGLKLRALD